MSPILPTRVPRCTDGGLHQWVADGLLAGQKHLKISYFPTGWTCRVCEFQMAASRFGWDAAELSMKKATIWTDGACSQGHGGWGCVIEEGGSIREISGRSLNGATCQAVEVRAALEGLKHLSDRSQVTLVTDSRYLANSLNRWIGGWQRRGWKRYDGNELAHADLWKAIWNEMQRHEIRAEWIKGHNGDLNNERADTLAQREAAVFGLEETALLCVSCGAAFEPGQDGWESYQDHLDVCVGSRN